MNVKIIIFFLIPFLTLAQNIVNFKVVDESKNPISRAVIIITQAENQIEFGSTNNNGDFEVSLPNGNYTIKISKLGYISNSEDVTINKNYTFNKSLASEINKLETVVIKSRPLIMKVKKDTISYNIKSIIDGTENKVEDLIKKLPGLNVDEAGKVSYKGQEIDKVLIDGNDFFSNKHQMATKNVDAIMIAGIDLLLNHTGFAGSNSGADKTIALNLKLKSEYRNRLIGDFEIGGGINNATKLHNNLFKFLKNGNLAIIADYNSISKTPITVADYQDMQSSTIIENDDGSRTTNTPSFLDPNKFYTDKKNSFIGIHYTSVLSTQHKLTVTNVFNNTFVLEKQSSSQSQIGGNSNQSFFNNKNASFLLNSSLAQWEFNKSKDTYMKYVMEFTPNADSENNDITNPLNVLSNFIQNQNLNFAHKFTINTTFAEKIKYNLEISNSYQIDERNLKISNSDFIFDTNLNKINQNFNSKSSFINAKNNFTITKNSSSFGLKINAFLNNDVFSTSINESNNFINNASLSKQIINIHPSWLKSWNSKISSKLGISNTFTNLYFQSRNSSFIRFEPNLNIAYNLSVVNKISFNYSLSHQTPLIEQLLSNATFENFQTKNRPSTLNFNQISPKNDFSIDFMNINLQNQSVLFFKIMYSINENAISNNARYVASGVENQFVNTRENKLMNVIFYYDLKLNNFPLSFKNTISYIIVNGISQFDGEVNNQKSKIFANKHEIISNLKNINIQFNLGFNYNHTNFLQSVNSFENTSINYKLFFTIKGKFKTVLKWDIQIIREKQDSGFSTNTIDFLNCNAQINLNKKMKLILTGYNLLNLSNVRNISTNLNNSFFTETVTEIMPGYFMGGINYSF
jgi:hypothetical protein